MTALRLCVAGVGAIGGTLAACLARGGASVSLIARGQTLSRLRSQGLTLTESGTAFTCHPPAAERAAGPVDVLFLTVKSHQLSSLLPMVLPAIGRDTLIVPIVNGMPWWMATDDAPAAFRALPPLLDPTGQLAAHMPSRQIAGCVAYAFSSSEAPGQVHSLRPMRLVLGLVAPDMPSDMPGGDGRLNTLAALLNTCGIDASVTGSIHAEVWTKLVSNVASNPLSVITGATLGTMATDKATRAIVHATLGEAMAVGMACGIPTLKPAEAICAMMAAAGPHQTSMLQDFRTGRRLETVAIGDALVALARALGVPTPVIDTLLGLVAFQRHSLPLKEQTS
ncbi:ketopantoate reductase family protein [Acidomonas methanolica]|uniref:ketopantoate reductase family protein n=1 Tax=Acidomonas methanolica TaxID=437 RepID=UPI002119DCF9|nr:2-dehydropantoate 2-reductase [Acidomonas methanolica]